MLPLVLTVSPHKSVEEGVANGLTLSVSKKSPVVNSTAKAFDLNKFCEVDPKETKKHIFANGSIVEKDYECMENEIQKRLPVNDLDENLDMEKDKSLKSGGTHRSSPANRWNHSHTLNVRENKENVSLNCQSTTRRTKNSSSKETTAMAINSHKDEHLLRYYRTMW